MKENERKQKEDMIGVLLKRRILMRYEKLQENRDTMMYTIIFDHNIQSTM